MKADVASPSKYLRLSLVAIGVLWAAGAAYLGYRMGRALAQAEKAK